MEPKLYRYLVYLFLRCTRCKLKNNLLNIASVCTMPDIMLSHAACKYTYTYTSYEFRRVFQSHS